MTNNNVKATATATVENGVASTDNITYTESLVAGHTYTVNAEYLENDTYEATNGTGTLEIQKIPTTTTISGNDTIYYGETVTLSVVVKENNTDTSLSRGTVSIYDGNECIQSNYTITGTSTNITFIPSSTGVHDIYAIYTDSGVEYNSSNSNHLSITVNKRLSSFTGLTNSITMYFGDTTTISGVLKQGNNTLGSQNVKLIDYDGTTVLQTVTTDGNGAFSFSYSPNDWNIHNHNLAILYDGTNTIDTCSQTIPVTLQRHDVTLSLPVSVDGYTDEGMDITASLVDERGNPVDSGTIEWTIQPLINIQLVDAISNAHSFHATLYTTPEIFAVIRNYYLEQEGHTFLLVDEDDNEVEAAVNDTYGLGIGVGYDISTNHTWTLSINDTVYRFIYEVNNE